MAKYIVARGQIEKGRDIVAKTGDPYTPKNAAETKRLLARGVIVSGEGERKTPADDGGKAEE